MKLEEILPEMGKERKARRKSWRNPHCWVLLEHMESDEPAISFRDLLADDWELEPPKTVEVTKDEAILLRKSISFLFRNAVDLTQETREQFMQLEERLGL